MTGSPSASGDGRGRGGVAGSAAGSGRPYSQNRSFVIGDHDSGDASALDIALRAFGEQQTANVAKQLQELQTSTHASVRAAISAYDKSTQGRLGSVELETAAIRTRTAENSASHRSAEAS